VETQQQPSSETAPVQGPSGTISWAEHVEAWTDYAKHYKGQSAERIAERGGFGYNELVTHLGHAPVTFEQTSPRRR
jgi:hypothetical protein